MGVSRRRVLGVGAVVASAGLVGHLAKTRVRILALGDSYTVGTAIPTRERWVDELVAALRAAGFLTREPTVLAGNGWTTDRLLEAVAERSLGGQFDLATLLIGVNDAFGGRPVGAFRGNFARLLAEAIDRAGGQPGAVLVMTIPDYTATPVGERVSTPTDRGRLERYNRVVRAEAAAAGARVVDLVPLSRRATERPELVAEDGLHPSPAQHALWLERIRPAAIAALRH